ncbi:MAG: ArsR family transcriptional regulator [Candidatus Lokiarchaeota archaeon]|nr:ArsR family transcriptional regulator [Candidatus Lokiarchaeota archaeon]
MASSKKDLRKFGEHGPPVEVTLKVIGGKWKPLIIYHLMSGTHRSGELHKKMPFVTRRMFTKHLRELEADEIVTREVYKEVPPRVEYSLTEIGRTLKKVLDPIHQWGIEYIEYLNQQ